MTNITHADILQKAQIEEEKRCEAVFKQFSGALMEFYMTSGQIFRGVFAQYHDKIITLKGLDGKFIVINKPEQIEAYTYIFDENKNSLVKEKNPVE